MNDASLPSPRSAPRWSRAALGNIVVLLVLLAAIWWLRGLQGDGWWLAAPRGGRWLGAAATLLAYLGFVAWVLRRSRPRAEAEATTPAAGDAAPILVAWASQTGFAQQLAQRTAETLRNAGQAATLLPLDRIDAATLAAHERALFVASTTGEGDPPDHVLGFVRQVMAQPARLSALRYAVLALGDREYEHFCGFGHQLDGWLRQHGAQPLFDLVEVDNADESALRHWQHHLGLLGDVADLPDWAPPRYQHWTLAERRELNPGSAGGSVFHLALRPPAGTQPAWQAGDIAEVGPRHAPAAVAAWLQGAGLDGDAVVEHDGARETLAQLLQRSHLPGEDEAHGPDALALAATLKPLPHREYSIASLPADGSLQILLRRLLRPDGTPGLGSGWLCDHAPLGGDIALRVRANPNFHPPASERPLILIGNGTGIAGLRALLKARIAAGARRNWLLFGERNRDRDFFFGDEILAWQAQGFIERLDLAFSRDPSAPAAAGGSQKIYVQQRLRDAAGTLRAWVADGAAVYVCGSLAGMAPAVDAVLREALDDEQVEAMRADGRYRRDVY